MVGGTPDVTCVALPYGLQDEQRAKKVHAKLRVGVEITKKHIVSFTNELVTKIISYKAKRMEFNCFETVLELLQL